MVLSQLTSTLPSNLTLYGVAARSRSQTSSWSVDYLELFRVSQASRQVIMPARSTVDDGGGMVIWQFTPTSRDIWLGCHYGRLLLLRPIPAHTSSCRYTIDADGVMSPLLCS